MSQLCIPTTWSLEKSKKYIYIYILDSTILIESYLVKSRSSLLSQTVKNLPVMQETQIQSLGWDDPLQKKIAIHSSILAWEIPWTEEPESKELDRAE